MVGRYAITYKNFHKIRKKIKLVIVVIKFYFNLLSVHVEAFFASLAMSSNWYMPHYSKFYTVLFWFVIELLQLFIVRLF